MRFVSSCSGFFFSSRKVRCSAHFFCLRFFRRGFRFCVCATKGIVSEFFPNAPPTHPPTTERASRVTIPGEKESFFHDSFLYLIFRRAVVYILPFHRKFRAPQCTPPAPARRTRPPKHTQTHARKRKATPQHKIAIPLLFIYLRAEVARLMARLMASRSRPVTTWISCT